MAFSLGEYQDIFLEEADEQLQELNQNLLELEKNPDGDEIINNIFRAAHSLKSSAAFVGLNDLSDLAHKMENLLQGIRDNTMEVSSVVIDVIFQCFDEISSVIETVANGEKPTQDLSGIIDKIKEISENSVTDAGADKSETDIVIDKDTVTEEETEIAEQELSEEEIQLIIEEIDSGNSCIEIDVFITESAQMRWIKAQLVLASLEKLGEIVKTIPPEDDLNDDTLKNIFKIILLSNSPVEDIRKACIVDLVYRIDIQSASIEIKDDTPVIQFSENESFVIEEEITEPEKKEDESEDTEIAKDVEEEDEEKVEEKQNEEDTVEKEKRKVPALKTVKVSVDKLDELLNNVGELVISNSGFFRLHEEFRKVIGDKSILNEFKNRMEQMSRIAKDLQGGIMKTRMVPIGQVFNRYNRLVRDLAKDHNKNLELIIKGEDTELDKKVIDAIGEPLLHLIRNAVDHGVESTEIRNDIGKSETAHLTLNAYQSGNQIFVEVSDDGKGLDAEQIKTKAIERELATPEVLSSMNDSDIFDYIFAPGFSTAEKITDISGRGVGMNVVKEIVTELNGNVSIESEIGMGTKFILTFPLTLAIIPAIMVKVNNQIYAIPLSDVIETIKISELDITSIEGHEVINIRGEILSLLRLDQFLDEKSILERKEKIPVVIVGFGNRKIGLIVDSLEGKQEIVIKSLEQNYKIVEGLAGASILGDGSICLILDVNAMINKVIIDQDKLSRIERESIIKGKTVDKEKTDIQVEESSMAIEDEDVSDSDSTEHIIEEAPDTEVAEEIIDETVPSEKPDEEIIEEIVPEEESIDEIDSSTIPGEVKETHEEVIVDGELDKETIEEEVLSDKDETKDEFIEDHPEIFEGETTPLQDIEDIEVDKRVHDTLEQFRQDLKQSIKSTEEANMEKTLDISDDDLREFQAAANVGAANAAESLSGILNKRIDLSIPDVGIRPFEEIPGYIGNVDSVYIGVLMPIIGDSKGTILFIHDEEIGFELIDMLNNTSNKDEKKLTEDGESTLKEITNIVGSAVLNVFAEKTGMLIKPNVPTIVHDYLQSVIDSILVMHNMQNDYAVVMDTAFYFEDDKVAGSLLLFPELESLKAIIEGLKSHVG